MDRLTSMAVFARVSAARSFSAAARELGISQATASKHVQMLEGWVGTRLLHRTTRRVGLTEAGESFFAQCTRILEDLEASRLIGKPDTKLRGNLRITAPVAFGSTRFARLVADAVEQCPDLSLNVTLCSRPVDVIDEGYDLAIRLCRSSPVVAQAPGLIAHQLGPVRYVVCASPAYIARRYGPEIPEDLAEHDCLTRSHTADDLWQFTGPDGVSDVRVRGRLKTDNGLLRREAARAGAGVILAPDYLVEDDLARGSLTRLLPNYTPRAGRLDAVCPVQRAGSLKVQGFVAYMQARLGELSVG